MSAPRPFRLQVLDALTALIRQVSPANDFHHDLSAEETVVRGRLFIGDDEPVPMVAINEPPLAIERVRGAPRNPNDTGEWDILIQGWAKNSLNDYSGTDNAYILAAEVRQVLASEKTKASGRPGSGLGNNLLGFGTRISDMRIGAPVVRPPDETSAKACFYIVLTLQISEDMTKPFG